MKTQVCFSVSVEYEKWGHISHGFSMCHTDNEAVAIETAKRILMEIISQAQPGYHEVLKDLSGEVLIPRGPVGRLDDTYFGKNGVIKVEPVKNQRILGTEIYVYAVFPDAEKESQPVMERKTVEIDGRTYVSLEETLKEGPRRTPHGVMYTQGVRIFKQELQVNETVEEMLCSSRQLRRSPSSLT